MRLNPSSGFTLDHLGLILSAVKIRPDCARLPPTPPRMTANDTAARNGVTTQTARIPISMPAPASSPPIIACGCDRKGISPSAIWVANMPPPASNTQAAPASDKACATSGDLGTSPFLRACSSFRGVASSVFDSGSGPSANGASREEGRYRAIAVDEDGAQNPEAEGEHRQPQNDA